MLEDELLKVRFKAGSVEALRRIYEKYRDPLLTLAMGLVNDAGTAEDVVHDAFVSFARSGARFRVRVGPIPTREEATRLASRLKSGHQLPTWILSRDSH